VTLNDEALRRYARHIVLPEIGGTGQARLLEGSVLIVGMGGLGAPLALYLAAAGVGRIGLVDDDRVDLGNLQRQVIFTEADIGRLKVEAAAQRLQALNAGTRLEAHSLRLAADNAEALITGYDVVADGTDNGATRRLAHDAAMRCRRPLVAGSVQGVDGQLTLYRAFAGPPHPCLHCLFGDPADAASLPSCAQAGVLGPAVGLVGSLMALEVVKYLAGIESGLSGTLLHIDALAPAVERLRFARPADCARSCKRGAAW
jgi:molybdopterin/thiamine biosynthesis adenylyltransferase